MSIKLQHIEQVLEFSSCKSTSSDTASEEETPKAQAGPAEDTVSMFRLIQKTSFFASGSMITLHQCWNSELLFNIVCVAFMDLNIKVFEHPFHIAFMYLWGSGLYIMLMLVIETGYPIRDYLLLLNSLPDPRGKLQVCLNLQQLAAVPLESCRK